MKSSCVPTPIAGMCSPTGCCTRAAWSRRCSWAPRPSAAAATAGATAEVETRPAAFGAFLCRAGQVIPSAAAHRRGRVLAAEVYAIAEAVRRRRGGCAVVMGRLSPRTRNAQVALYQEKEVDFLVATDAIGMGLNMDVDHVAFAGLRNSMATGPARCWRRRWRRLPAGRGAGCAMAVSGVTGVCPPLGDELVDAVEAHVFAPLELLAWRNSALDFASVEALLGSLTAPPTLAGLVRGQDATDVLTLEALNHDADIRKAAQGGRRRSCCGSLPDP